MLEVLEPFSIGLFIGAAICAAFYFVIAGLGKGKAPPAKAEGAGKLWVPASQIGDGLLEDVDPVAEIPDAEVAVGAESPTDDSGDVIVVDGSSGCLPAEMTKPTPSGE